MRILVLQLARFGDIYLTWPVLRALRRSNPNAEIHLLVRERFCAATEGLGFGVVIHTLPTRDILAPLIEGDPSGSQWTSQWELIRFVFDEWLDELNSTPWDRIINLSFSPSSSYLTDLLARDSTEVSGYRRHTDGYLSIPDDASAYFYAQVGPQKHNRIHLVDLFAMVARVDLKREDWNLQLEGSHSLANATGADIVIHLAASQAQKCYPVGGWRSVIDRLVQAGRKVILIGAADERALARDFEDLPNVDNRVGETQLRDLFLLLAGAGILVGADSAPIHIAALTGTPVLNLSFDSVCYWETGPVSKGSYVLYAPTSRELAPEKVAETVLQIVSGAAVSSDVIHGTDAGGPRFFPQRDGFSWNLIRALYMEHDFPCLPHDRVVETAIKRILEACDLANRQFEVLKQNLNSKIAVQILESVDQMLLKVPVLSPAIAPLISWFETERLRIPPGDVGRTFARTSALFNDLATICQALIRPRELDLQGLRNEGLARIEKLSEALTPCAHAFRFFQTAAAEPMLESLLDHLSFFENSGLNQISPTKVGQAGYKTVLDRMIRAFEARDYVIVADALEYEIPACLKEWRENLEKWPLDKA